MKHIRLRKDLDDYLNRRSKPQKTPKFAHVLKKFRKHLTARDNHLDDLGTQVTVIHEKNIFEMAFSKVRKFFRKINKD